MRVRVGDVDGRVIVTVAVEVKVETDLRVLRVQRQQLVLQPLQPISIQNDANGGRNESERESERQIKDVSNLV
jgi:hypothetical protein